MGMIDCRQWVGAVLAAVPGPASGLAIHRDRNPARRTFGCAMLSRLLQYLCFPQAQWDLIVVWGSVTPSAEQDFCVKTPTGKERELRNALSSERRHARGGIVSPGGETEADASRTGTGTSAPGRQGLT
jgi:hypothetical protein